MEDAPGQAYQEASCPLQMLDELSKPEPPPLRDIQSFVTVWIVDADPFKARADVKLEVAGGAETDGLSVQYAFARQRFDIPPDHTDVISHRVAPGVEPVAFDFLRPGVV